MIEVDENTEDTATKPNILCVDDEPAVLSALRRQLRKIGKVFLEESCTSALELIKTQSIDLVITDMRLPGMTGAEFLVALNQLGLEDPPARILLTGYSDGGLLESAINGGRVDRFLNKPWNDDELINAVDDLLKKRSLERENRLLGEQLKKRNQQLTDLNDQLSHTLALVDKRVLTASTDPSGTITHVSSAFAELTQFSPEELVGNTHELIRHPDMSDAVIGEMWLSLERGEAWVGELLNRRKDGSAFWVEIAIEPECDKSGALVSYTAFYQDITDKKRVEWLSNTDQLTGLYNRRKLESEIERELARAARYGHDASVILFDIDHFKRVNDTFGHPVGDQVLIQFAECVKANIRSSDTLGRWGGEEFLILCPHSSAADAANLAEKVRLKLAEQNLEQVGQITASFGVGQYRSGEAVNALFRRVDDLLYRAKEQGRNRVEAESTH